MAGAGNRPGPTEERLRRAKQARLLYDTTDMSMREIAERLGIRRSFASELLHDPDGSRARARKDKQRKPCPDCGKLMSGGGGKAKDPAYCADCIHKHARTWTRERVIQAFQDFHRRYGRSPTTTDRMISCKAVRRKLSDVRLAEAGTVDISGLPVPGTVHDLFGGWREAVEAAGLPPSPIGSPSHRDTRRDTRQRDGAILDAIREGYDTVNLIAAATGRERAALNRRLLTLVERGILTREKERWGRRYHYHIAEDSATVVA